MVPFYGMGILIVPNELKLAGQRFVLQSKKVAWALKIWCTGIEPACHDLSGSFSPRQVLSGLLGFMNIY